jgi:polyferredoxin
MVIRRFPYEIVGQLGLLSMLVGRMACGWLCPFGLLQDLLFLATKVEVKISHAWRHVRWFVLIGLVILLPWIIGDDIFSKVCPLGILTADLPWLLWNPLDPSTGKPMFASVVVWAIAINLAILAAILVLSAFIKRPFCRVLCPLGHIFSLFNKVSLVRLEVASSCDQCNACQTVCPVDIKVYEDPNSSECIRCLSCTVCGHVKVGSRRLIPSEQVWPLRKVAASDAPSEAKGAGDAA